MNTRRIARYTAALACIVIMGVATAPGAQETPGLAFDVTVTTGDSGSRVVQTGRGWITGQRSRIDLKGPGNPTSTIPGMSGSNVSFIVHDSADAEAVFLMLDHDNKQFAYPGKMMEELRQMMAALQVKPRFSVTVSNIKVDTLGAGETISGFATKRYRVSADVSMSLELMGESTGETMHVVSEGDYAEELTGFVDPLQSSRTLEALSSGMPGMDSSANAELRKLEAARPRGLPLRQTDRVTGVTENGSVPEVTVTAISNIRREPVAAAIFAIPEGYKELVMPMAPLN